MKKTKQMILSENRATTERDLQEHEKAQAEARKNSGFTQLDDVGVRSLEKLMVKSVKAGNLFLRLTRQMDTRGAVVASRSVLADLAGVDVTNVSKLLKLMTEFGLVREAKQGGMRIIAINPQVAWRSWNNGKEYAIFNARVILNKDEWEDDSDFDIRRGSALIKMAKKARKKKTGTPTPQKGFPPPLEPVETIETDIL